MKGGKQMSTIDFDTLKAHFVTYDDRTCSDEVADAAEKAITARLTNEQFLFLEALGPDKKEFDGVLLEFLGGTAALKPADPAAKTFTEETEIPGGYPAVLPWPPAERMISGDFPGYGIDFRGIPHGVSGKGRKLGELRMDRFRRKLKGGGTQFICRYKMTDKSGKRIDVYLPSAALARTVAEEIFRVENGDNRSWGVRN